MVKTRSSKSTERNAGSHNNSRQDIAVIGGSAGGLEALREIVGKLPPDYPGSLFVVIHTAASGPGLLAELLNGWSPLKAQSATDGQQFRRGLIYVAPPDNHLVIADGHIQLTRGPRENYCRPAIDPLFRTAASVFGKRVAGVVLSGMQDDGTAGLAQIKQKNGIAIVQRPGDATFSQMPQSALEYVDVDYCVPASEIASLLDRLARSGPDGAGDTKEECVGEEAEDKVRRKQQQPQKAAGRPQQARVHGQPDDAQPAVFTCPDCQGSLWELRDGRMLRFRCHVGHTYSPESLMEAEVAEVDRALWSAIRALQEFAAAGRRLAEQARKTGHEALAKQYVQRALQRDEEAEAIRRVAVRPDKNGLIPESSANIAPETHRPPEPANPEAANQ